MSLTNCTSFKNLHGKGQELREDIPRMIKEGTGFFDKKYGEELKNFCFNNWVAPLLENSKNEDFIKNESKNVVRSLDFFCMAFML